MTRSSWPQVIIIVINWNGHRDTLDCLASLRELDYDNFEIVLVDNGSAPEDVRALRAGMGTVRLIEMVENTGFVRGNNAGIALARQLGAEYVMLLNNDTTVAPDLLMQLMDVITRDETIAAVGPTICYASDPEVIWSAGGSIDWRRGRTSMMLNGRRTPVSTDDSPEDVDFLTGCAMLVRTNVIDKVGGMEPRFFAYYEETEWCVRMKRSGYRVLYVPQGKVWHKTPRDSRVFSPLVHYYMTRNRLLFLKLTGAGWRAWAHTILVDNLRTLASWAIRPKWRHLKEHRAMMVRGLLDYYRGCFGECPISTTPR